MNRPVSPEPAWKTYIRAVVWIAPFSVAWVFCAIFLMPTVESLWVKMGAPTSKLATVIEVSSASLNHGRSVMALVVLCLVLFEVFCPAWEKIRRAVVEGLTYLCAVAVLFTVLCMAIATVALVSWDQKQANPTPAAESP